MSEYPFARPPATSQESPNKRASSGLCDFPTTGTPESGIKTTPKRPASAISGRSSEISQDSESSPSKRLASASSLISCDGSREFAADAVQSRSASAADRQLEIEADEIAMDQSDIGVLAHSEKSTAPSQQSPQDRITKLQAYDSNPDAFLEDIPGTSATVSPVRRQRLQTVSPQDKIVASLRKAERIWYIASIRITGERPDTASLQVTALDDEEHIQIFEEIFSQYTMLWTVQLKVANHTALTQWTTLFNDNRLYQDHVSDALKEKGLKLKKIVPSMFQDRGGKMLPDVTTLHDVMICLPSSNEATSFGEIVTHFMREQVVGRMNANDGESLYSFVIFGPNRFSCEYIKKLGPELSKKLERLNNKFLLALIFIEEED